MSYKAFLSDNTEHITNSLDEMRRFLESKMCWMTSILGSNNFGVCKDVYGGAYAFDFGVVVLVGTCYYCPMHAGLISECVKGCGYTPCGFKRTGKHTEIIQGDVL